MLTSLLEMGNNPKFWVSVRFGSFDDKGLILFGFLVLSKKLGSCSFRVLETWCLGSSSTKLKAVSMVVICNGLTVSVSTS